MEELLAEAGLRRVSFERATASIRFDEKGILPSEMFFLLSAVAPLVPSGTPTRIVESGRARGQSTLLMALCLPEAEIVSVELAGGTLDAELAEKKLARFDNVELLFGDSRRLPPELTRPGDVVVIDGPKGHRAVKLALATLGRCRPAAVFIHDCYQGSEERRLLDKWVPGCLYSDDPRFEELHAAELDRRCWVEVEEGGFEGWRPHFYRGEPAVSYGPTYCVPAARPDVLVPTRAPWAASGELDAKDRAIREQAPRAISGVAQSVVSIAKPATDGSGECSPARHRDLARTLTRRGHRGELDDSHRLFANQVLHRRCMTTKASRSGSSTTSSAPCASMS